MKRETVLHCWGPRHSAQIDFQGEDLHMIKLSALLCLCAVAAAVKIDTVSQVISLVQDLHTM